MSNRVHSVEKSTFTQCSAWKWRSVITNRKLEEQSYKIYVKIKEHKKKRLKILNVWKTYSKKKKIWRKKKHFTFGSDTGWSHYSCTFI